MTTSALTPGTVKNMRGNNPYKLAYADYIHRLASPTTDSLYKAPLPLPEQPPRLPAADTPMDVSPDAYTHWLDQTCRMLIAKRRLSTRDFQAFKEARIHFEAAGLLVRQDLIAGMSQRLLRAFQWRYRLWILPCALFVGVGIWLGWWPLTIIATWCLGQVLYTSLQITPQRFIFQAETDLNRHLN
jgi:hypothetical protein